MYRRDAQHGTRTAEPIEPGGARQRTDLVEIGTTLMAAALDAGEHDPFVRIMDKLRLLAPDLADGLGW